MPGHGRDKRKPTDDATASLSPPFAFRISEMAKSFPVRADQALQGTWQEFAASGASGQTGPRSTAAAISSVFQARR